MKPVTETGETEIRMAILALEGEYAKTWDIADEEAWAALFTEDGVFEMVWDGDTENVTYEGREALAGFCTEIHQGYNSFLHLISTPSLTISDGEVRAWINYQAKFRRGPEHISAAGVYQVRYVLTADGWRIKRRVEKLVQQTTVALYEFPTLLEDL